MRSWTNCCKLGGMYLSRLPDKSSDVMVACGRGFKMASSPTEFSPKALKESFAGWAESWVNTDEAADKNLMISCLYGEGESKAKIDGRRVCHCSQLSIVEITGE